MPKSSVTPKPLSKKPSNKSGLDKASNLVRSVIFFFLVIVLCTFMYNTLAGNTAVLETVPLSDVVARANDPEGNIKKITVA